MKYLVEMLQILCFIEATIATYPRKKNPPKQNKTTKPNKNITYSRGLRRPQQYLFLYDQIKKKSFV